jgi:hypothetical protein
MTTTVMPQSPTGLLRFYHGTISSFGMARENAGLFAGPVGDPFAAAWAGIGGHVWCGEGFRVGTT